jgi:hypothetical protein
MGIRDHGSYSKKAFFFGGMSIPFYENTQHVEKTCHIPRCSMVLKYSPNVLWAIFRVNIPAPWSIWDMYQ